MTNLSELDRRTFLRNAVGASGLLAFSGSAISEQLVEHALKFSEQNNKAQVFNPLQMQIVKQLADLIIPDTETKGAVKTACHFFVDSHLFHIYSQDVQTACKQVIDNIEKNSITLTQKPFIELSQTQQIKLLTQLEQQKSPWHNSDYHAFKQIKYLLVFGYFTSQVGATQALKYQAVPGGYKAIKITKDTPAWGSKAFL